MRSELDDIYIGDNYFQGGTLENREEIGVFRPEVKVLIIFMAAFIYAGIKMGINFL